MITLLRRDHLLAIDAEVLPLLVRPARDGESPRDQRRRHRPASRSAPAAARGRRRRPPTRSPGTAPCARSFGAMSSTCHEHRPRVLPRVLEALGRLGLLEEREQLADLAQRAAPVVARPRPWRAPRAAACRTDCPARASCAARSGCSNSSAGPPALQHAVADLGHLEPWDRPVARMRFSSPRASSCAMKSRRSRYPLATSDH